MHASGLLIVDDHPVYREALTEKLGADFQGREVHVMGVGCAEAALEILAQSDRRWVVVLDIHMPGLSGLAGIKAFKAVANVDHVVSISGLDEKLWEPRCVQAGASLFLSKNNTSPYIFKKLEALMPEGAEPQKPEGASAEELTDLALRLTVRQKDVLALIAQGHPNKVIASLLEISEHTVKIHIHQIFKELRVFNRTQAVLKAMRLNLI